MQSDFQKIQYQVNEAIATITLNDPTSLNALDSLMKNEILQALQLAEDDPTAKVIILTGAGRAFSSGGDIREMSSTLNDRQAGIQMARSLTTGVGEISRRIRKIAKPIIARINGTAAGAGMNIVLACDFRIAAENAKFLQAFINIGLIPDAGGIYLLNQLIGASKTAELVMLGEQITAEKACDLGLVNQIVPLEQLDTAVNQLAHRLAKLPSLALASIKQSINQIAYAGLDIALEQEVHQQVQMAQTEDFIEGITAFMQKRPANFQGK